MDLATRYLGMTLKHPIVVSSSPLSWSLDGIRRLEEAGAAAVVLHSLFEEQVMNADPALISPYLFLGDDDVQRALQYFPDESHYPQRPYEYLDLIARAKAAVDIPIIASLNGVSSGGWIGYARLMEEAGADAIELNISYLPSHPRLTGAEIEEIHLEVLRDVKRAVRIPVAVKLSPFFSAMTNIAIRMAEARADALVLFNRFYQPDIDLERMQLMPSVRYSRSEELLLPLTWTSLLYGRVPVDLAITTGVHTHEDVLKGVLAGAKVTMMASELLQNGLGRINATLSALEQWMSMHDCGSIVQIQGSLSQLSTPYPEAHKRASYIKVLQSLRVPGAH